MGLYIMTAYGVIVLLVTAALVTLAARKVRNVRPEAPIPPASPGPAKTPDPVVPDLADEAVNWLRDQVPPGQ